MKDLGEARFIPGIKIYRDRTKRLIGLSQSAYIDKILKRFKMKNFKRSNIPMQEILEWNKTQALNAESLIIEAVAAGNKASSTQVEGKIYTHVVQRINVLEKHILKGKLVLVDDDEKQLKKVDYLDNLGTDDEVKPIVNETASFLALIPLAAAHSYCPQLLLTVTAHRYYSQLLLTATARSYCSQLLLTATTLSYCSQLLLTSYCS
ncbi:hypothetical protein Tco_0436488 [Tanacetum coccineum]